jgi:hypothetical protein
MYPYELISKKYIIVVPAKAGHAVLFSKPPGATVALSSIFAPFWTLAFAGVTLFDSFEIGSYTNTIKN